MIKTTFKEYIDADTGERVEFQEVLKPYHGTRHFWKVYLSDFMAILGILDSKQLDVMIYICEHTNPADNIFYSTHRGIAKEIGVSKDTVTKVLGKLQKHYFLTKVQNGVYRVNPNKIVKGDEAKKRLLVSYYDAEREHNANKK